MKKKGGKGNIKPEDGKQFSSDYQPSPEAKSEGKKKARELRELANALLNKQGISNAKGIAESLGIDLSDDEYTLEICMTLKQIERAITKADTKAYIAAMDRLRGKPVQMKLVQKKNVKKQVFIIGDNVIEF